MKSKLLTESVSIDNIKSLPYFSKFPTLRLFRGIRRDVDDIIYVPFKFRDKPLDTDIILHNAVNKISTDEFGLPVRNLIFTTENESIASKYGSVFVIVPKGDNFKLFYHPTIEDMTYTYDASVDFMGDIVDTVIQELMEADISNDVLDGMYADHEDAILNAVRHISIESSDYGADIKRSVYNDLINTIDDDSAKEISSLIAERIVEDIEYSVERIANEYVEGIEEATRDDEYSPNIEYPEIMLYAPDGVYLVQEYLFDD